MPDRLSSLACVHRSVYNGTNLASFHVHSWPDALAALAPVNECPCEQQVSIEKTQVPRKVTVGVRKEVTRGRRTAFRAAEELSSESRAVAAEELLSESQAEAAAW